MRVITAPETFKEQNNIDTTKVFLAGGIANSNWQAKIIKEFQSKDLLDSLIIYNPRRENFPIDDFNAVKEQTLWEFNALEDCDIFSMYFCAGTSDQPICMYELGRNLVRMQDKFFMDWDKRIVITIEAGYKKINDVLIQTKLATNGMIQPTIIECTELIDVGIRSHMDNIIKAYNSL